MQNLSIHHVGHIRGGGSYIAITVTNQLAHREPPAILYYKVGDLTTRVKLYADMIIDNNRVKTPMIDQEFVSLEGLELPVSFREQGTVYLFDDSLVDGYEIKGFCRLGRVTDDL